MIVTGIWWELGTLVAGALLAALVLAVGHWFPWAWRLSRIQAYVYGVVSIWLGFAAWRLLNGDWVTVVGLGVIAGAGGVTVVLAYRLDGVVRMVRQARKAEGSDDELAV